MANIERMIRGIFDPPHDTEEKAIVAAAQRFLLKGGLDGGILDLPEKKLPEKKEDQPPAASK